LHKASLYFIAIHMTVFLLVSPRLVGQDDSGLTSSVIKEAQLRPQINKLANAIAENVIHSAAVGYTGEKTIEYDRFEQLYNSTTSDECLILISHRNAAVRGYAFWALAKKHYTDLDAVYEKLSDDNTLVHVMQGCLGDLVPLHEFTRWVVTPKMFDLECKKLNSLGKR